MLYGKHMERREEFFSDSEKFKPFYRNGAGEVPCFSAVRAVGDTTSSRTADRKTVLCIVLSLEGL
jgi:hypothetical protein